MTPDITSYTPVDSWLMVLKLHYRQLKVLQFERLLCRRRLTALEGRQRLASNLTGDDWPSTGQKVRERTRHENAYKGMASVNLVEANMIVNR